MKVPVSVLLLAGGLVVGAPRAAANSVPAAPDEPFFPGTGAHSRKITTDSPEAQRYFDQGMAFLSGFNHDEAIRSFRAAAHLDPKCAMAWWGVALAYGPHINLPVVFPDRAQAAWEALRQARVLAGGSNALEQALIEALGHRYADPQPDDRGPLDRAYADAMRRVWHDHPNDADIGAWFAEALMDLRPWDQWAPDGTEQPGTAEVLETLEAVLKLDPAHPLANHLYIHAVEASPHPERADAAANLLRGLTPGLGHLVHMPSHTDIRCGRWLAAITANQQAIEADREYRALARKPPDFYRVYIAHNRHMLAYAAMMSGRAGIALTSIRTMVTEIPADWLRQNAAAVDGYIAMPYEVMVRFGKWDELLAEPEPADYLPLCRTLWHAARAVAFAAQGNLPAARAEETACRTAAGQVPADVQFGNNAAHDVITVAQHMAAGEILFRDGKVNEGLVELRTAIKSEDALHYDEPPEWILPVRHALGAALLQTGRLAEAEQVYRDDLVRLPENGWSLFGLARTLALENRGDEAAAVKARFKAVWAGADLELTSSCLCQPGV